jgi:tyrosyl-tRNA synthetase
MDILPPKCFVSEFLQILAERGFIHQCTDAAKLDARFCAGAVTAYNGFDLTADSLHVGHLIPVMMLRWLQKTGHKPIVLLGGVTTRIGDPSFRDTSRPVLSTQQIEANLEAIKPTFHRFLSFGDGPTDAIIVNNTDWLGELGFVDLLLDIGRHFSVNRMLTFDSVRQRLDRAQSLSLLEFNYMILQAFDFLELARTHGCALQLGASDQWGNIINGVELARRSDGIEVFGLTAPLLTTSSGSKMGKSASGAIWLNADKLSPYDFWQFWRNTADEDVGRFLRLFTELPVVEIVRLEHLSGAEINEAKKILADEVTALCHGRDAADAACGKARAFFETETSRMELPQIRITTAEVTASLPLINLLVTTGLSKSKGEARRLIRGGGARLNGKTVEQENICLELRDFVNGNVKLSAGRKKHIVVRIE